MRRSISDLFRRKKDAEGKEKGEGEDGEKAKGDREGGVVR